MQLLASVDKFMLVMKSLPTLESCQELLIDLFEAVDDILYIFAWHKDQHDKQSLKRS